MTTDELRRRREETQVEIRKAKREDSLNKRRNIVEAPPALTTPPLTEQRSAVLRARDLSATELKQQLPTLVQALYSPELSVQYHNTVEFRKVLAKELGAPIQMVIEAGVVPRFVEILAGQSAQVAEDDEEGQRLLQNAQFEAAWVLTNIASGTSDDTMAVAKAGAVPVFIRLMRHPNGDIREQCIWALGNIAGDGPKLRDYVLQEDMMSPLLENVVYALDQGAQPITTIRNGAWAISNLCRGLPAPSWNQIVVSLQVLFRLLQVKDDETIVDCAWALAYMTGEGNVVAELVNSGIVPHLVPLLGHPNVSVQVPALRAVGNIVTGADRETQSVVDAGGLALLRNLLNHTKTSVVKEACWAISNVTAGTSEQIQAVLDANIIPKLVNLLAYADYKVKKEACWALCNATSQHETHPHQTKYLVSQGVIKPLCDILENSHDQRVILVALDGLTNILAVGEQEALLDPSNSNPYALYIEEARGVDIICQLQDHPETDIYLKAKGIIDKHYGGDAEEEVLEGDQAFEFHATEMPQGGFEFA
jgi:HEAT repeat protein